MARRCTVCTHSDGAAINEALATGRDSCRGLARQYRVSPDAVERHRRRHLSLPRGPAGRRHAWPMGGGVPALAARREGTTLATTTPAQDRRTRFVQEYLVDLNATQAAIRAGYSPRTAGSQASDLLKKPQIQAAIQASMDARARRVEVTADEVLAELKAMVLSRVDHYEVAPNGRLKLRAGAPPGAMGAVASFRRRVRRLVSSGQKKKGKRAPKQVQEELDDAELRLWSKPEAIRLAMQHLKLIGDDQGGGGGGTQKVFFLPTVAASVEDWQRQVAERRAAERTLALPPPST